MPGEKQVGSVSIRVVPDTTRFKAELERQLASIKDLKITANLDLDKGAAQAELDRISAERPTITANLDLDTGAAEIQKALLKKPVKIPAQVDVNQSEVAKAAAKLKAIHIPADVDNRNLQSLVGKAFAGIKPQHIPVDIDQDSLARLLKPIDELHAVKVKVQADIDRAAIAREMETLHLKTQLDVDTANFHKALADAEAGFKKFDNLKASPDLDRSKISRGLADIKILGQDVFSSMGKAASAVGDNFKDAFDGVSGLAGLAGGLIKVEAIASAIGVAGAAITAAWGAASTAVAAVPAAIGLIGAPLATVALGMDGIKKAASALTPEFNKLKSAVSSTFQTQLKPVFDQLKGTLTALTPQIQAVATSMVGLAQQTANFITTGGGLQLTQTLFTNVAAAIKQIDLVPLLDGFLKLAGNQSALQALTTTINTMGLEIQKIANLGPTLDKAFQGLEGTLKAVTTGLGDLVNNGIKLFAAAAPGVNAVINSLTGFFNRFNWDSLGTSVSGVFQGIAQAIDGIDPGTITGIENAFAGLANVFKDPAFQQNIQNIASALPALVNTISGMTSDFASFASEGANFLKFFDDANTKFVDFQNSLNSSGTSIGDTLQKGIDDFTNFSNEVGVSIGTLSPQLTSGFLVAETAARTGAERVHRGIVDTVRPIESEVGSIGMGIASALDVPLGQMGPNASAAVAPVPGLITLPLAPVPAQLGQIANSATGAFIGPIATLPGEVGSTIGVIPTQAGAALAPLPGLFADRANAARLGFGTGIKNISPETAQQLGLLGPAVTTGLTPAQDAAAAGATAMTTAFTTALLPLGQAFTTITPQITAFGTALTAMNPQLLAFGTTFTTLNPQILAFGTTLTTLNPQMLALGTTFTTLNPQILAFGTTLTTLNPQILAFGTTLTTLNPQILAFGTTLTTLNPQILAFGTTLTTLNPQLLAFGTTLTTLNPQMLALGTTFTTLNPQILAFGTTLTTLNPQILAFGTTLTTLNPQLMALSTSFTTINPALTAFSAALTAAGAAATAFGAAVQAAFTAVGTAVTTGMTTATTAVTTGFQTMTQTATTGGQAIVKAATTMMTDFAKAVTDGMRTVNDAVKTGMATALKTAQDGAKQFVSVGAAIDKGIADGITQNSGIVQDAVRKVVADAKKAADDAAKVNSPSKLFRDSPGKPISEGIGDGILLLGGYVEDSARSVVLDAHAAAQRAADNLPDISDAMFEQMGLNDLGAEIEARVNASIGDSNLLSSGGDVYLTVQSILDGKVVDERFQKLNDQFLSRLIQAKRAL